MANELITPWTISWNTDPNLPSHPASPITLATISLANNFDPTAHRLRLVIVDYLKESATSYVTAQLTGTGSTRELTYTSAAWSTDPVVNVYNFIIMSDDDNIFASGRSEEDYTIYQYVPATWTATTTDETSHAWGSSFSISVDIANFQGSYDDYQFRPFVSTNFLNKGITTTTLFASSTIIFEFPNSFTEPINGYIGIGSNTAYTPPKNIYINVSITKREIVYTINPITIKKNGSIEIDLSEIPSTGQITCTSDLSFSIIGRKVVLYGGSVTGNTTCKIDIASDSRYKAWTSDEIPVSVVDDGAMWIYNNGWHKAIPWIYNNGWQRAVPWIYNNGWKRPNS